MTLDLSSFSFKAKSRLSTHQPTAVVTITATSSRSRMENLMGMVHQLFSPKSIHSGGTVFGWRDSFQYLVANQTPAMSGGSTSPAIIRLRRLYFMRQMWTRPRG